MQVRFENVMKKYGDFCAVRELNLTIKSGSLHFLLGPSGCGKTTSLRMLAGLEDVSSGDIYFDDRKVTKLAAAERGIGMVFQNYALWPHMTVRKNIEYGLKLRKLSSQEIRKRVDDVLAITQLDKFIERFPGQLSGGQQQRVALARALAIRPNVLLLDEPLSNLDAKLRLEMRDNITRIHRQTGITTVYVTHDQKEALSMGSHVSVMRAGVLVQSDAPRVLYNKPKTAFIAGFIGETNLLQGVCTKIEGQDYLIDVGFTNLRARNLSGPINQGDPVTLSIRPEAITVKELPTPQHPSSEQVTAISLQLEHLTYLGEQEQMQLRTPNGLGIKVNLFNAPQHSLKDGDQVTCHFGINDILMIPGHADLESGT